MHHNQNIYKWLCVLLVGIFPSCRDKSTPPTAIEPYLTGPTLIVPVGLLKSPRGIAVDPSGDFWVADTKNDLIRRFTSSGTQRDSVIGFTLPTCMGIEQSTGNVLAVVNNTTIVRINPSTHDATIITTVSGTTVDTSSVYDVNSGESQPHALAVHSLGDIDGAPNGDIFVSALAGSVDNAVIQIHSGSAKAIAFSSLAPSNPADIDAKFLAVDTYGMIYTAFVLSTGQSSAAIRVYALSASNPFLNEPFPEPAISGGALGAGIDASGILFIADQPLQQIVIVSTISGRTIDVLTIPQIQGMTQPTPRDIAVGPDGSVYVAVGDLFDSAELLGAVLKYSRGTVE